MSIRRIEDIVCEYSGRYQTWSLLQETLIRPEYGVSTSIGYGVSNLLTNTAYSFKLINTAYPLPLDTAYRSSGTETGILKELQEVMAEPILSDNIEKALTESNLSITSNDINIELSKEFLVELRKNIYHRTYNEDVVDHIAKGDGKVTTWEELIEKFFSRFYPESYDREDEMLDDGENWRIDPLEFLLNVNTSFKNHKKVDGRTQKVMNGNWNKRYVDNSISSNNELKESKYENPSNTATDSFFKAYEVRDIEKQS
ncbi:hypothetical protein Tco_0341382 [Tanacetum coccineum]